MNETLFKKYNVPVPRYTSYPTANEFEPFDAHRYLKAVETSNDAAADNISFYIHVPFCRHLGNDNIHLPSAIRALSDGVEIVMNNHGK